MLRPLAKQLCVLVALFPSVSAAAPGLQELLQPLRALQVKISPDGEKIAVASHEEGKRVLALMTLDPLEITYVLRLVDGQEVGDFYWVNDDRVVTRVMRRHGWMDSPIISGTLYALNYDGRRLKTVFGYEVGYAADQTRSRIRKQEIQTAHAAIISTLPGDRAHILVSTYPWEVKGHYWRYTGETIGEVLKLNIYNGKTKKLMSLPTRGGRAYASEAGEVHFAYGSNVDGVAQFFRRSEDRWVQLGDPAVDQSAIPVGYSDRGDRAYLLWYMGGDTSSLVEMDLKSGATTELYRHPRVHLSGVVRQPGSERPIAVHLDDGLPSIRFLQPDESSARTLQALGRAFAGYAPRLESASRDGRLVIVKVAGDNNPGDFYLVDLETKALTKLMSAADQLSPEELARTEVFELKARDGLSLQGYLTFPAGERKNLPLVVLPHGGPSARDYWRYDRERQILAGAGYLVMSVNFRGSTGYGHRFQRLSDGAWGSAVQDDITDATRWVLDQGFADPARVCIYGVSFGAYSALMGAIREPDLYRCAAGFAGIYDLEMLYTRGDIPRRRAGVAYLKEAVGTDREQLQKFSPVHAAHKIKIPVFIAHGGEDQRAPIEQAEALEKALREAGVPVQSQYYEEGGHGYYSMDANKRLYVALLGFLEQHIGQR